MYEHVLPICFNTSCRFVLTRPYVHAIWFLITRILPYLFSLSPTHFYCVSRLRKDAMYLLLCELEASRLTADNHCDAECLSSLERVPHKL